MLNGGAFFSPCQQTADFAANTGFWAATSPDLNGSNVNDPQQPQTIHALAWSEKSGGFQFLVRAAGVVGSPSFPATACIFKCTFCF